MRVWLLALLTALLLPAPLLADTTYTYTGNDFTFAVAPFTTSDSVSGWFTVAWPLPGNLSTGFFTPEAFSFTDGVDTITNATATLTSSFSSFSTNTSGDITGWEVYLLLPDYNLVASESIPTSSEDLSSVATMGADNSNDPGTWTESGSTSPVPEPESLILVGTGLAAAAGIARRRLLRA